MEKEMETQEEIASWFDKTYKLRANQYLRPVEAYEVFLDILNPKKSEKILDVACGVGRILQAAKPYEVDNYGIDISKEAIKLAKVNLPDANLQVGNAEALPYPDNYFDYVTCIGSLERFLSLDNALKEQLRVTKKDAEFCFLVRNADAFSWRVIKKGFGLINKKGHQGAKRQDEWTNIFQRNGLKILHIYRDQWPIKKVKKWSTLGLGKVDYKSIDSGILPLEYVGEFIFHLKKTK